MSGVNHQAVEKLGHTHTRVQHNTKRIQQAVFLFSRIHGQTTPPLQTDPWSLVNGRLLEAMFAVRYKQRNGLTLQTEWEIINDGSTPTHTQTEQDQRVEVNF